MPNIWWKSSLSSRAMSAGRTGLMLWRNAWRRRDAATASVGASSICGSGWSKWNVRAHGCETR